MNKDLVDNASSGGIESYYVNTIKCESLQTDNAFNSVETIMNFCCLPLPIDSTDQQSKDTNSSTYSPTSNYLDVSVPNSALYLLLQDDEKIYYNNITKESFKFMMDDKHDCQNISHKYDFLSESILLTKSDSIKLQKFLEEEGRAFDSIKRRCKLHSLPCESCNILSKRNNLQEMKIINSIWNIITAIEVPGSKSLRILHKYVYRNDIFKL